MTEAIITFGLRVVRVVSRKDLRSALEGIGSGGEFDTASRLLQNTWRAGACAIAYVAFWAILFIPWELFNNLFRASNPNLSRAIVDIGSAAIVFVATGFILCLLRVAVALTLAQREVTKAGARVEAAMNRPRDLSTASPRGLVRVAVLVTTPTDFDLVFQAAIAVWALVALVNYAHSQHYPL